jgi:hypothetical protein
MTALPLPQVRRPERTEVRVGCGMHAAHIIAKT